MLHAVELDVRHLRALCAIADTGSVRKAAARLGMTQPSLTTQLRRIEHTIGGPLFTRGRGGSQPTPLGRAVLVRARPIVTEMRELVAAARDAAVHQDDSRLRVGSVGSRAVAGWLRGLRRRLPETETAILIDMSPAVLLRLLATDRLDVALVPEVRGFPLRIPDGVDCRVLIEREPQFSALASDHPAAGRPLISLSDLAADPWMVDPTVEDECAALRWAFAIAGVRPRTLHVRDNAAAWDLVASGEAVRLCQPTAAPRDGIVVRPLRGDPLTVRLLVAFKAGTGAADQIDAIHAELRAAYLRLAQSSPSYWEWLTSRDAPVLTPPPATDPGTASARRPACAGSWRPVPAHER